MGETGFIPEIVFHSLHADLRKAAPSVYQVELRYGFAVADRGGPPGRHDDLGIQKVRLCGPVDSVPFKGIVPDNGIRTILGNIVPGQLNVVVSRIGLYRGRWGRRREFVVGVVDCLYHGDGAAQFAQIRSKGQRQAEPFAVSARSVKGPEAKTNPML